MTGYYLWAVWAIILLAQNAAFTLVSRARNSASIFRHVWASVLSNGIWFVSQMIIFSKLFDLLTGKAGLWVGLGTWAFYTTFTVLGALSAHYISLRTEKGKAAVGASAQYAQIPKHEWERVQCVLASLVRRTNNLEDAHSEMVGSC